VLLVSLITKRLGGSTTAQIFSAFFTATIPMGILQSTTTQNDYVVAFWLLGTVALLLETTHSAERILPISLGLCLGLAALTKTTAYFFGLPFMLYFILRGLARQRAKFIPVVLAVSLIALSINLPHFVRNFSVFENPFGPSEEVSRHQNEDFHPTGLAGNVIRNLGLYAGSVEPVNNALNSATRSVFRWMNVDIDDPRYTLSGYAFSISRPVFHEDTMGSSWHLALAVIALIVLFFCRKQIGDNTFLHYGLLTLAGFLLFCLLVRWMPWNIRLHLPLLVMSGAWVGLLAQISKRWVMWAITIVFAVLVLPVFYFNPNKPLVADYNIFNLPRREVMITRKNLVVPYIESVNYLADEQNCYQAGLYLPDQEWEYPFWSLYADTGQDYRLEHVNVENASAEIPMPSFSPCAVIATQSTGETFTLNDGTVYHLTWSMEPVYIYTR